MIRDVAKARDYYWSLLEEAKGQEPEASKKVEPRFAIRSFVDEKGKTKYYVKADGARVLHGRDPAKWAIQIENYIQNLVNDEGTIDIKSADGSALTITGYGTRALKTTAGELSNFSDYYDAYGNLMPEARTRAEASLYIDEVAQVSKDAGDVIKTDKGAEHEDLAINGWKYRDVFFEDVDGKYYQITLSVPQGIEGKQVAYGIGNIRNRKSPINLGSSLSGAPKDGTLSAISIRDGAEKSNPQFENSKKNSRIHPPHVSGAGGTAGVGACVLRGRLWTVILWQGAPRIHRDGGLRPAPAPDSSKECISRSETGTAV